MALENLNRLNALFGPQFPSPLPTTRHIELVRTRVEMVVPCAACQMRTGSLTCSRCWAVKYCSKDCQRGSWKDHKEVCNRICTLREEVEAAAKALVTEFGGMQILLTTELVRKGLFNYIEEFDYRNPVEHEPKNANDKYILARGRLVRAYERCGKECLSSLAFRLAAENVLDLLCLTYSSREGEHVKFQYCGWMLAGGMNQEALNYICYFHHRKLSEVAIPYLDMSKDEDIEGDYYLDMLKIKKNIDDWSTLQWFHDYMMIALIKYKKLQTLSVQKQKDYAGWKTFLMGTHPRVGNKSAVLMLRGKTLVAEKIKSYILCDNCNSRVLKLAEQIEKILTEVNQANPLIIPGIIDVNSIPDEPVYEREEGVDEDSEDEIEEDYTHDAGWAYANYASAWHMSSAYIRVLRRFLDYGKVSGFTNGEYGFIPVEGMLRAAFDVDPSRNIERKDDLWLL